MLDGDRENSDWLRESERASASVSFWSLIFRPRSVSRGKRWALSPKWEESADFRASVMPALSGMAIALSLHSPTLSRPGKSKLSMDIKYKSSQRRHLSLCLFLDCTPSSFLLMNVWLPVFRPVSSFGLHCPSLLQVFMAKAILLSSRLRHLKFDVLTESYKRDECLILITPKCFHVKAEGLKLRLSVSLYLNPQPAQSGPPMLGKWSGSQCRRLHSVCYFRLTDWPPST